MQSHPSFRSSDDETSRDSGFVDLEQEQAEMLMQTEFTTAQMDFSFSSINTSREMTLCEKLELDKLMLEDGKPSIQMQLRRSTRKPLSDLNLNSNLHDDSPKSRRALFKSIPLQRNATIANIGLRRKRSTIEDNGCSKRLKLDALEVDVGTEAMDIPCTSKNEAVPPHPARTRLSLTRTNSMPVFDRNQENIEPPMMEIETQWHLETVTCRADSTAFRRISADTLYGLLTSMTDQQFNSKYILIDCRYPFEYDGGHIRNAINLYDPLCCEEFFYPSDEQQCKEVHSRIPIFYCEFSQHRGPQMANVLRSKDRLRNMHHYPRVDFMEMYVVNEGYRNFYHFINVKNITSVCEPHS
ncbi:hypothetical protein WR25_15873 [Diploscapter pachys]|uniref:M-phase inducer phosphatase n=1 Tax=Diploscapter pachys TaxID=2018661 RepID=A0A2A2LM47_9BILA|nr:hypothetical protein WR25_15873 [Diploscapter pachys]